jgi:aldose 1-epimerase
MPIYSANFGTVQKHAITKYILDNGNGIIAHIIDYGGIITQLHVPGRNGSADVVLGFDTLQRYLKNNAYLGAVIGRYANRIARGSFILEGITRNLDINEPPNHLHGGFQGFHRQCWQSDAYLDSGDICLRLYRLSPDGEGGYPGNLEITVIYRLTMENVLGFEVLATTDQTTPVSITQHSYFNLAGHDSGDIGAHQLQIESAAITPTDSQLIPTGDILAVHGTPYDVTCPATLGPRQRAAGKGFDCNYILDGTPGTLRQAAILSDLNNSGRVITLATTTPALQFYDGSKLAVHPLSGKENTEYTGCAGLCLEPQHYPDAVNRPLFPSPILRPGERYTETTTYAFTVS